MIILISLLILSSISTLAPDDASVKSESGTRSSTYSAYDLHTIHGGSLAGGVGSGNFDMDKYQELVFVGGSSEGRTVLLDYNLTNNVFDSHLLWRDPNGGLIDIVVDELDQIHPGPEILVAGYSGNLTMIRFYSYNKVEDEIIWQSARQNNDTSKRNPIFGLAAGDFDSRYPGPEIIIADAKTYFVYVLVNDNEIWVEHSIPVDDLPRKALVGDFDQTFPGNELLVTCVNGSVYRIAQQAGQWHKKLIYKDSNSPMSLVIDDFNITHKGHEVIIAGLSRNATLIWGSGEEWYNTIIWQAPGALEGIAFGEFDELHKGNELVIAGYSSTAVMLYETAKGWYNELIFYDPNPLQTELNGALVTDFYPDHIGSELLVVGFTGNVTMLIFEPPNYKLSTTSDTKTIIAGEFTTFRIAMRVFSGYNNSIILSVTGLPEDAEYSFSTSILKPYYTNGQDLSSSVLTVETSPKTIPGTYNISIIGTGDPDDIKNTLALTLIILPQPKEPDFIVKNSVHSLELNLSQGKYSSIFEVNIIPLNGFNGFVELYVPETYLSSNDVKEILNIEFKPSKINSGDTALVFLNVSEDLKDSKKFIIPIYGENKTLGIDRNTKINFNVTYFKDKGTNGEENKFELNPIIPIIMLSLVLIIIFIFLITRMRALSRTQDKDSYQREKHDQKILNRSKLQTQKQQGGRIVQKRNLKKR